MTTSGILSSVSKISKLTILSSIVYKDLYLSTISNSICPDNAVYLVVYYNWMEVVPAGNLTYPAAFIGSNINELS